MTPLATVTNANTNHKPDPKSQLASGGDGGLFTYACYAELAKSTVHYVLFCCHDMQDFVIIN